MQEVEIPPRDLLQHYVNCPSEKGKTLLWWFSTKRKNISFGLYYKRGKVPSASPNVFISSSTTTTTTTTTSPPLPLPLSTPLPTSPLPTPTLPDHPSPLNSSPADSPKTPTTPTSNDSPDLRRPRAQTNPRHFSYLVTNSILSTSRSMSSLRANLTEPDTNNPTCSTSQIPTASLLPPESTATTPRRRISCWTPKDPDMVCILPIERYDSATTTVKGSHRVQEEGGTYVLVFDNTFSRNTSKRLTFFVAMKDGVDEKQSLPELSGWLLKKKRKKMQGWAKRWFQLDKGLLSYYKDPNSYCRGSIQIAFSTVSVNPGLRLIHIDSGNMLYHLKCLNQGDFEMWKGMIRKYKSSLSGDGNHPMTNNENNNNATAMELSSTGLSTDDILAISKKPLSIVTNQHQHPQEGSVDVQNASHTNLPIDDAQGKQIATSESHGGDPVREKALSAIAAMNERYAIALETVEKALKGTLNPESPAATSPASPASSKLHRERSTSNGPPSSPNDMIRMSFFRKNTASSGNLKAAIAETPASTTTLHAEVTAVLAQLKRQQDVVAECLRFEIERRKRFENACRKLVEGGSTSDNNAVGAASPARVLSGLASPSNSGNFVDASASLGAPMTLSPSSTFFNNRDSLFRPEPQHRSTSRASSLNTTAEEVFFDAEEVVLDVGSSADEEGREDEEEDEEEEDDDSDSDSDEGESPRTPIDSQQQHSHQRHSTRKTKRSVARRPNHHSPLPVAGAHGGGDADSATSKPIQQGGGIPLSETFSPTRVFRRKFLPAPVTGGDVSLLSILRKNIGKDLSTIPMPISLNEPINLLQRLAENLEFSELLDHASGLVEDSMMRLLYVAAFVVSGFSSSRGARKPFNPLLGETYECVREDKGFRFIAEKVSHQPLIMACHAESDRWIYWTDSKVKTAFWGKSMEFSPFGTVHLVLKGTGDHYTWTNPTTWMRNMMGGNKYVEHSGESRIINHSTGETCVLQFKESGFFSSAKNEVSGTAICGGGGGGGESRSKDKKKHQGSSSPPRTLTVSGKWSEALFHETGPNQLSVLWKVRPPLPDAENYYGFTAFAMELNELTPDLAPVLPPTDTRFRPDQRLFENGLAGEAEEEKLRVEERQRNRRKEMEARGTVWTPAWFELVEDPIGGGTIWGYKGGYWEARKNGKWPKLVELW